MSTYGRALRRRYGRATAASKKRFDDLRVAYRAADEAVRSEAVHLDVKYGPGSRSWAGKGEKDRLEKLEKKRDRIGDSIVTLIVRESPRGEAWKSGVPTRWLQGELSWDDIIRPANEPLSNIPPPSYGWSETEVRRHLQS